MPSVSCWSPLLLSRLIYFVTEHDEFRHADGWPSLSNGISKRDEIHVLKTVIRSVVSVGKGLPDFLWCEDTGNGKEGNKHRQEHDEHVEDEKRPRGARMPGPALSSNARERESERERETNERQRRKIDGGLAAGKRD